MAVGPYTGVWESDPIANLNHRRHLFEVDLMHDAVARWDDVHIVKGRLGPVNEMETVFIPSLFDCAVFFESIFFETGVFHRQ